MRGLLARMAREPVMLVAAVLGTLEAVWPSMSSAWKLAFGLWGALIQRTFSVSKAFSEEQVLEGINLGQAMAPKPAPRKR